jgi:carboxymethylenebutenolidase
MTNLDFPAAVKELGEAVSYLKSSGASKVGVVGFCMGGALTFAAAQHAGVSAAAPFYGIPDPAICDVSVVESRFERMWREGHKTGRAHRPSAVSVMRGAVMERSTRVNLHVQTCAGQPAGCRVYSGTRGTAYPLDCWCP